MLRSLLALLVLLPLAACSGAGPVPDELQTMQRQCADGQWRVCGQLAIRFETGDGVTVQSRRALDLYAQGCGGRDPESCGRLGQKYHDGSDGLPVDLALAATMLYDACVGEYGAACAPVARLYEAGGPVVREAVKAARLYEAACKALDGRACADAAALHEAGEGIAQSDVRAAALYRQSCQLNWGAGCAGLAAMLERG